MIRQNITRDVMINRGGGERMGDDFRNPKVVRSPVTYRVCNLLPFPGGCEKYQRCINLTFNSLLKSQHPQLRIASEQFMNRFGIGYMHVYKLPLCSTRGRFVPLPMMRLLNIRETVSSGDESLY